MPRLGARPNNYVARIALVGCALLPAPIARGEDESLAQFKAQIEAEVNAIKQKYETKIEGLEKRVESLEGENAQLKGRKSAPATSTQSPEVSSLKQRVSKL